jgi:hypothetical protein
LAWRIVQQPPNSTAGLSGAYKGTDKFTFAAWDGQTNSNLGTATVTVN